MNLFNFYLALATSVFCLFVGTVLLYWAYRIRHSSYFLKWWFLSMVPVKYSLAGWAGGNVYAMLFSFDFPSSSTLFFRIAILLSVAAQSAFAFRETRRASRQSTSFVLIVEDNETLARIYRRILEAENYSAEFATSGYDALTIVNIHKMPDLIITDIHLPDMTGTEFVKKVRMLGFAGKAIAISGLSVDNADKVFVEVLVKPVTAAELTAAVRRIV